MSVESSSPVPDMDDIIVIQSILYGSVVGSAVGYGLGAADGEKVGICEIVMVIRIIRWNDFRRSGSKMQTDDVAMLCRDAFKIL